MDYFASPNHLPIGSFASSPTTYLFRPIDQNQAYDQKDCDSSGGDEGIHGRLTHMGEMMYCSIGLPTGGERGWHDTKTTRACTYKGHLFDDIGEINGTTSIVIYTSPL